MCVPLATLFLTALQRLFKALLGKGNNPSHPLWLALPSCRVWWGTLWCAWTSCPWGLQHVGFLPTALVPGCLLATSLQIWAVAGAGTTQYCFYGLCPGDWQPVWRVRAVISVVKVHCLSKAKARGLLSEGLLDPGQTCMEPGTWSDRYGRNFTYGHVFSAGFSS